jgi:hypothetical protein
VVKKTPDDKAKQSMTDTHLLTELDRQTIEHCTGISEDGLILQWGAAEQGFEVVCRTANIQAVLHLERLLTEGYEKACVNFAS